MARFPSTDFSKTIWELMTPIFPVCWAKPTEKKERTNKARVND
jgi:hypothetical protein